METRQHDTKKVIGSVMKSENISRKTSMKALCYKIYEM